MRAIVDENNQIVTWANNLNPSISIDCPDDYTPETYDFINGEFIPKEPSVQSEQDQRIEALVNAGFSIEQAQLMVSILNNQ